MRAMTAKRRALAMRYLTTPGEVAIRLKRALAVRLLAITLAWLALIPMLDKNGFPREELARREWLARRTHREVCGACEQRASVPKISSSR